MTSLPIRSKRRYTVREYLEFERGSRERHEYRDGEIVAMAGGSPDHSRVIVNLLSNIHAALKGKTCAVYDGNLRVRIPRTPLYLYPDASIICGGVQLDSNDDSRTTATNPRVIAEVLSPSTEGYDRGEKFNRYREIESLQEYVLVSQDVPRIEVFFRQSDGTWLFTVVSGIDARARLASVGIELSLAEIYLGIEFNPAADQVSVPTP